MITTMPAICTPILGTRLWVQVGVESVSGYAPKPRRVTAPKSINGVDLFHNSTGVSAAAERRLR